MLLENLTIMPVYRDSRSAARRIAEFHGAQRNRGATRVAVIF
jgi:hypothetical protein